MRIRRPAIAIVFFVFLACVMSVRSPFAELRAAALSNRLTDEEFWTLTEQLSELNGSFRSDNFLSNERGYQLVIPELVKRAKPGGVYLGVGPEQNFAYIVALKSAMAFIIDIRRGNLHEHLLYKALFEMSADRADFLSLLFSRRRPSGLSRESSVSELFDAYDPVRATPDRYAENLSAVTDWLTKTHHFNLSAEDIKGLDYVYHDAFYAAGPGLNYNLGRGGSGGNSPSYEDLMRANDGTGGKRGYLATEESFAFLKDLETRNLLVPVVGNFGGPKAIRAVGQYVKDHDGTVAAFYLSNVEQYLNQDGIWGDFCESVATLPLDETSTYIYSGRGAPNGNGAPFGGSLQTNIRPMLSEVKTCSSGGVR